MSDSKRMLADRSQALPWDSDGDDEGAEFVYETDGSALVSGGGSFIADVKLPRMLECCFARSPIARGRILSIDTSSALAAPGVVRIANGAEIARAVPATLPSASAVLHASENARGTFNLPAYHLLPVDSVHYEGEAVAVIAAEDGVVFFDAQAQPGQDVRAGSERA